MRMIQMPPQGDSAACEHLAALQAEQERIARAIAEAEEARLTSEVEGVKTWMAARKLTFDELAERLGEAHRLKAPQGKGISLPIKYRGPNGEEWSGRGKTPVWLRDYPETQWAQFLVSEGAGV